jgi:hypothetical protein
MENEMKKVRGKIDWIADKPNKYQDQLQLSIKVNGAFYNFHETEEKLKSLLNRLKKGFEVELSVELNIIKDIEVLNDKVEQSAKGSFKDQLDKVNYKTLTDQAHKIGLVSMDVEFVPELSNVLMKTACFKATATIRKNVGVNGSIEIIHQTYVDFGDACGLKEEEGGNIEQKTIRNAWIRMASTRAQVRALKQATNNMEVAEEELPSGTIEDAATTPSRVDTDPDNVPVTKVPEEVVDPKTT